jgi:hypothetical protein
MCLPPHLRTETDPVSETSCCLVSGISDDGQSPLNRANLNQWSRLAISKGPNRVGVSPPHLRAETDSVSETSCFPVSRISDDGQSPKTKYF